MSLDPRFAGIREIVRDVRGGSVPPGHFAREALERIRADERHSHPIHAFLSIADGESLASAAAECPPGALSGVPVAVKDNIATLGLPTTCGSRMLEGYLSPYEATAVRKLREAGAIIVGKTNLDEFAMGSSTENSAFGPTRNPLDRSRVPGGSSGGSAAAVAAGMAAGALGSETGGSVRQAASMCGVVGIKPSYGRVSRYGLVAFASSLDQVGTFGRTVFDAALLLEAIAGHDARDSTSAERPVPSFTQAVGMGVEGMVVGVAEEYHPPTLDPELRRRCREALDRVREAGAEIRDVSLPHTRFAIPTYCIVAMSEASSNLARFDGVRHGRRNPAAATPAELYESSRSAGFGAEVKRRIMLGTFSLSAGYHEAHYGRARKVRALIARDFERVFADGVDVLFTVTANLAGIPAISIPVGTSGGLPVGGQILAPRWGEADMLRMAGAMEGYTG